MLALCTDPKLLDSPDYPADVKKRVQTLLGACAGSVGAYTDAKGVELIREDCARYIEKRDGHPADASNIYLTNGASEAVKVGCLARVLEPKLRVKMFTRWILPCIHTHGFLE